MSSIADFVESVADVMSDVEVKLGKEFIDEHSKPPRIVFVPNDDGFGAATVLSGAADSVEPSRGTRRVGLTARIWGKPKTSGTYRELRGTEALVDRFISTVKDSALGSVSFESGTWLDGSPMSLGRVYTLALRVDVPIIPAEEDSDNTSTEVESFDGTLTLPAELPGDEVSIPTP